MVESKVRVALACADPAPALASGRLARDRRDRKLPGEPNRDRSLPGGRREPEA
jgi:hypothetical protein